MRTIADQWADFERLMLPKSAGPTQRTETKGAFYAGAQATGAEPWLTVINAGKTK